MSLFPYTRNRRLRTTPAMRNLVRETIVTPHDFIVPLFVIEGTDTKEEIPSMPGYYRMTLDHLKTEVMELQQMGLQSVLLFVKVPDQLKDNAGVEALNPEGLMQRAIKTIRDAAPDLVVMTDVALDPYSIYGHDGIIDKGVVHNDATNDFLAQMAVSHAAAGAHVVAPSDMMDGRIAAMRDELESQGYTDTSIMAYSAKYASAFYGPFRDALDSAPVDQQDIPKDKKTYQMDPANRLEAVREAQMDLDEGADILMVKPGLCYLDIVRELRDQVTAPIAVYQVSGEYSMLKAAAQKGWLDHDQVMMEQLTSIKRAGATMIASYFARDFVRVMG